VPQQLGHLSRLLPPDTVERQSELTIGYRGFDEVLDARLTGQEFAVRKDVVRSECFERRCKLVDVVSTLTSSAIARWMIRRDLPIPHEADGPNSPFPRKLDHSNSNSAVPSILDNPLLLSTCNSLGLRMRRVEMDEIGEHPESCRWVDGECRGLDGCERRVGREREEGYCRQVVMCLPGPWGGRYKVSRGTDWYGRNHTSLRLSHDHCTTTHELSHPL
jgi:hypothetical protein